MEQKEKKTKEAFQYDSRALTIRRLPVSTVSAHLNESRVGKHNTQSLLSSFLFSEGLTDTAHCRL